jgi:hypothetical protein
MSKRTFSGYRMGKAMPDEAHHPLPGQPAGDPRLACSALPPREFDSAQAGHSGIPFLCVMAEPPAKAPPPSPPLPRTVLTNLVRMPRRTWDSLGRRLHRLGLSLDKKRQKLSHLPEKWRRSLRRLPWKLLVRGYWMRLGDLDQYAPRPLGLETFPPPSVPDECLPVLALEKTSVRPIVVCTAQRSFFSVISVPKCETKPLAPSWAIPEFLARRRGVHGGGTVTRTESTG